LVFFLASQSVGAVSSADLQAQIKQLLAQIAVLQAKVAALQAGTSASACHPFSASIVSGQKGLEVARLQTFLRQEGFSVSDTEVSASYFGPSTKLAVIAFQEKNANDVLLPAGLLKGTGTVGLYTREKINANMGCSIGSTIKFCGGIAAIACPSGLECKLDGTYPDAGGHCVPPQKVCTMDAKQCPDGSYVSRVAPSCEFAACPLNSSKATSTTSTTPIACPMIAKICPDGSAVGYVGPDCHTADCPAVTSSDVPIITNPAAPMSVNAGQSISLSWSPKGNASFDVWFSRESSGGAWTSMWKNISGGTGAVRSVVWWGSIIGARVSDVYHFKVCVAGTTSCSESAALTVLNTTQ
jgi:hypothetical protein